MFSCGKKGSCGGTPSINVPATVEAGGTLYLNASSMRGAAFYRWFGPDGRLISTEQSVELRNIQSNMAGKYKLEVQFNDGCIQSAESAPVEITIPAPPCNPTNNTGTLSGAGIGDIMYFSPAFGSIGGGSYFLNASSSVGSVSLEFAGPSQPVPGIYNIQPGGGQYTAGIVRLQYNAANYTWPAASGKVYVTVSNKKVTAVFCNISVQALSSTFKATASARITER